MTRTTTLTNAVAAELLKLHSLPAIRATASATVLLAAALSAAVAASDSSVDRSVDTGHAISQSVTFTQVGLVLIGVLAAGTEFSGHRIRIALIATPSRIVLLAGKAIAYLVAAVPTSAAAVCAGLLAAAAVQDGDGASLPRTDLWPLALGAGTYLVLMGLLALALAVLLRSLIPPLVAVLSVVLILSPLLSALTSHARYLPDQAGGLLYRSDAGTGMSSGTGGLVLGAWIAVIATAAVMRFCARDA